MLIYLSLIETDSNKAKFESIYTEYKSLMFHVANGILNNEQDAEDAVHDAFLSIAKNFDKISTENRHKTKAFVVIVVESRAINIYRRKKRHVSSEYLEDMMGITEEFSQKDAISQCFQKLPLRYRRFLQLKYVWGYQNRELSDFMGISEAGVRKLNQRAKEALEKLCREEGLL